MSASSSSARRVSGGPVLPAVHPNVRLIALLALAHVVVDSYASTVPALLPFWQERFGLTYALAGAIRAVADVTSSVAQPVVGILTDRGRNPRWIAVACLLAALGVSATGLAPSYPVFLGCVVLGGLGVAAFHPQGYRFVGLHSGERQAGATSWFLLGGNVGVAAGPPLGTAVVLSFGVGGTAALLVPGGLFAAVMWWLLPSWTRRRRRDAKRPARTPVARAEPLRELGRARRRVAIAVLVAFVALRSVISSALVAFLPLYYVRVAGTDENVASRVLSGVLFVGALATLAGGYLADRLGRMRVLTVSLVPVPFLLLAFLGLPPASIAATAALCAVGALVTGTFAITVVMAQELWHERRALASGLIVGSAFGMGGLLVPVVGAVADRWGLPAAFQVVAALPAAALVLLALLAAVLAPTGGKSPASGQT